MNADPNQPTIAPYEPSARAEDDQASSTLANATVAYSSVSAIRTGLRRSLGLLLLAICAGLLSSVLLAQIVLNFIGVTGGAQSPARYFIWEHASPSRRWLVAEFPISLGTTGLQVMPIDPQIRPENVLSEAKWSSIPLGWAPTMPSYEFYRQRVAVASGWPLRCVWLARDNPTLSQPSNLDVHDLELGSVHIATGILWPGLLFDALCFGAIWYPVLFAPGLIRRARRRRRGQCTACGYNLAATPQTCPCPECGTISRQTTSPTMAAAVVARRESEHRQG